MTGRLVVENFVRAFGGDELASAIGTDCPDYAQPSGSRKLYGRDSYCSACAVNQDCFASPRVRAMKERTKRGGVRNVHCRALCKRNVRR